MGNTQDNINILEDIISNLKYIQDFSSNIYGDNYILIVNNREEAIMVRIAIDTRTIYITQFASNVGKHRVPLDGNEWFGNYLQLLRV